jgi:hypothetical protein
MAAGYVDTNGVRLWYQELGRSRLAVHVGAENADGSAGDQIAGLPTGDLRVTSTPGAPGGSLTYSFNVRGVMSGVGTVRTDLTTPPVRGTTTDVDTITVTR